MGFPGHKKRTCTLCGSTFHLQGPAMAHPADLLCNACVAELWASDAPDAAMEATCAARVPSDRGLDPLHVASAIVRRVHELRHFARTRDELELLLSQRDPSWTGA